MLILSFNHKKVDITYYKGVKYIWYDAWGNGVSLGNYVLLGTWAMYRDDIINHEYGHTAQSKILGPLYLILIGVPSGIGNRIDWWFHQPRNGWSKEKADKWYYSQPWEKWADKLGNVKRKFSRAPHANDK